MLSNLLFLPFIIQAARSGQTPLLFEGDRDLLPSRNPTKSFWLDTAGANPLALEGSNGVLTQDADICVIGSGMTGISAAWHLQRSLKEHENEIKVVILEAREFCSGATGRNGGHLTPNLFSSFRARQALYGTSEAVKSSLIETYTSNSLVHFIKKHNLTQKVDLYNGGIVTLVQAGDEELDLRKDYEAALKAGLDLPDVRWMENQELVANYQLDPNFNYTAVKTTAHNLWPCKLVTELYRDAIQTSLGSNFSVALHTKTPVTSITRLDSTSATCTTSRRRRHTKHKHITDRKIASSQNRKWALHTPRGPVTCAYVLHASNAYAGHLLPFFKGSATSRRSSVITNELPRNDSSRSPAESLHDFGITPTRGQVILVPSKVSLAEFPWRNAWSGGGGHWEYFFPRFQHVTAPDSQAPFVVLGGGRQHASPHYEGGVHDDSIVNVNVGNALRRYLSTLFAGLFDSGRDGRDLAEMEWTGIMGYTKMGDPYVGPVLHPSELERLGQHNKDFEGQYIAAGYTGHGMVRAFAWQVFDAFRGESLRLTLSNPSTSAEVVASMIASKIERKAWTVPEWLPERYLTWNPRP